MSVVHYLSVRQVGFPKPRHLKNHKNSLWNDNLILIRILQCKLHYNYAAHHFDEQLEIKNALLEILNYRQCSWFLLQCRIQICEVLSDNHVYHLNIMSFVENFLKGLDELYEDYFNSNELRKVPPPFKRILRLYLNRYGRIGKLRKVTSSS